MLKVIREPDAVGVAVGKASARVLTRANVHAIMLRFLTAAGAELTRAQIIADASDIDLKLDGETIWGVDTTFLLDRQKYLGDIAMGGNVNGIVPLVFDRPLLDSNQQRGFSSLGLANVASVTLDITIIGVAQLSKIEVYSVIDSEAPRNLGQHVRIDRLTRAWASTGIQEITDMPFQDDRAIAYLAEHIKFSAGDVSKVRVRRNGVDVYDQLPKNINTVLLNSAQRTPQSGYCHIDFDLAQDVFSALPMPGTQSLYHELTWITAAPTTYYIYLERLFKDPKAK